MNTPKISIIAAIGFNRELGKNNALLWHISEDLKRFRELTIGHTVIMGRKTFESIKEPLKRRLNIVISRDTLLRIRGCIVAHSLEDALNQAKEAEKEEIFIIGGGQIYERAIKYADKLYLTLIQETSEADTFFPDYSEFKKVVAKEEGEEKGQKFTFIELTR